MMQRHFAPEISSFPEDLLTTNSSVEDIFTYCSHVSYVENNDSDVLRNSGSNATLTMVAQPAANPTKTAINSTQPAISPPAQVNIATTASAQVNVATPQTQAQQHVQERHDRMMAGAIQSALDQNNGGAFGASGPLRQTVDDLSGQQYPFWDEFDPHNTPAVAYDPFTVNPDSAFSTNSLGTYLAPSDVEFPESFTFDEFLSSDFFDLNQ